MGKGDASASEQGRKTPPQPSAKPSEAEQEDGLMTGNGEGTAALQEDACSTLDPDVSPKSENAQCDTDESLPKNSDGEVLIQGNARSNQALQEVVFGGSGGIYRPYPKHPSEILKEIREKWTPTRNVIAEAGNVFSEVDAYLTILEELAFREEDLADCCEQYGEPLPFRGAWEEHMAVLDFDKTHREPYPLEICEALDRLADMEPDGGLHCPRVARTEVFREFIESGPGLLQLRNMKTGEYEPVQPRCAQIVQGWLDRSIGFLESPETAARGGKGKKKGKEAAAKPRIGKQRKRGPAVGHFLRRACVNECKEGGMRQGEIEATIKEYSESFGDGGVQRDLVEITPGKVNHDLRFLKHHKLPSLQGGDRAEFLSFQEWLTSKES